MIGSGRNSSFTHFGLVEQMKRTIERLQLQGKVVFVSNNPRELLRISHGNYRSFVGVTDAFGRVHDVVVDLLRRQISAIKGKVSTQNTESSNTLSFRGCQSFSLF